MALNIDDVKFDDIPPGDKAYGHDAVMEAANNMAAMGVEAVSQAFEKSLGIDFGTLGERVAQDAVNKAADMVNREAGQIIEKAGLDLQEDDRETGNPAPISVGAQAAQIQSDLGGRE